MSESHFLTSALTSRFQPPVPSAFMGLSVMSPSCKSLLLARQAQRSLHHPSPNFALFLGFPSPFLCLSWRVISFPCQDRAACPQDTYPVSLGRARPGGCDSGLHLSRAQTSGSIRVCVTRVCSVCYQALFSTAGKCKVSPWSLGQCGLTGGMTVRRHH